MSPDQFRLKPFHHGLSFRLGRHPSDNPIDLWELCGRFDNFPTLTFARWWFDVEFRVQHCGPPTRDRRIDEHARRKGGRRLLYSILGQNC